MGATVQSLDRGLLIMRLLAEHRTMTATAIAAELGIHQSTASRLLNSLHAAGFVRKPDYHSFSLDWDALVFAGQAIDCFPAMNTAARVCNRITSQTGLQATVALLHGGHILYLTRTNPDSSLVLVNNSDYPIHDSSVGLALVCEQDAKRAIPILKASMGGNGAVALYRRSAEQLKTFGYIRMARRRGLNIAMPFYLSEERAALAIFSDEIDSTSIDPVFILRSGVGELSGLATVED